jgi:hypothetical protein
MTEEEVHKLIILIEENCTKLLMEIGHQQEQQNLELVETYQQSFFAMLDRLDTTAGKVLK